ncbi:MAG: hypothetical protein NVSMB1_26830 [Polyangiales bacterium]
MVIWLPVWLLSLHCGASRLEPVGVSNLDAVPQLRASPSTVPPARRWSSFSAVRDWTQANARRFPSAGHLFEAFDADVFVNDVASKGYASLAPGSVFPTGSVIAKVHVTRETNGDSAKPGPIFAMEKHDGGWSFLEIDAQGQMLREGRLEPCVACHAQVATQDELFGIPLTGR